MSEALMFFPEKIFMLYYVLPTFTGLDLSLILRTVLVLGLDVGNM
jgi:hypothetical protein